VVYVGQIRPYKGLPVLLRAADGLADTRLWVIGDGHQASRSHALAASLNVSDLAFWGHVPDDRMVELLQQAHVVVLPSVTRSEAFGIVLLEGMAAGMVPVASHLPGVADIVGNEGYTFKPGDSEALASILKRLRDDPQLRVQRATVAQAKAKLYSWDRVVFGYDRIFRNLVPQDGAMPVESSNGRMRGEPGCRRENVPVLERRNP
jgi:rhamnosyl/mannosyltransferase